MNTKSIMIFVGGAVLGAASSAIYFSKKIEKLKTTIWEAAKAEYIDKTPRPPKTEPEKTPEEEAEAFVQDVINISEQIMQRMNYKPESADYTSEYYRGPRFEEFDEEPDSKAKYIMTMYSDLEWTDQDDNLVAISDFISKELASKFIREKDKITTFILDRKTETVYELYKVATSYKAYAGLSGEEEYEE